MQMALEGICVLDMTMGQAGPAATQMLADMGAEVIKIEERVSGDVGRRLIRIKEGITDPLNSYFEALNRNKRSIALDLKKEKAKEILLKLVERSDVFVTNFRAPAIKRLGLDYESLSMINPKLIYAHASGYGKEGPDRNKPSFDAAALSRGGLRSTIGQFGGPPPPMAFGLADQTAAGILAFGIVVALVARKRTGMGQEVNTSLLGSQVWLGTTAFQEYLFYGKVTRQVPREEVSNPLWNFYPCQDGKWIQLAMLPTEPYWPGFCAVMGLENLEKDSRFESHKKRAENSRELIAILDETFVSKARHEWKKLLDERDLVWAPVNEYAEVADDPQVIANQYVVDFDHPLGKRVKLVGLPVKLSKTPGKIRMTAPELGQHTDEVLFELGYSREDLIRMKEGEVIR